MVAFPGIGGRFQRALIQMSAQQFALPEHREKTGVMNKYDQQYGAYAHDVLLEGSVDVMVLV